MKITLDEVQSRLWYCQLTGDFYWRKAPDKRTKPWSLAGHKKKCGRVNIKLNGIPYQAHRLAWLYIYKDWPKQFIDHINGNPSDNRIENLRDVSNSVNIQNQKKAQYGNRSGSLGVQKVGNKYSARITINKKLTYIGTFETPNEAHDAYLSVKRKLHEGNTL